MHARVGPMFPLQEKTLANIQKITRKVQQLSGFPGRFETQDIKTQPQFNLHSRSVYRLKLVGGSMLGTAW